MLEDAFPRSATAVATSDVEAVIIDQSAFTYILRHNPEIAVRMMRKLTDRLRRTNQLLEEAGGAGRARRLGDRRPVGRRRTRKRLVEIGSGIVFPLADQRGRPSALDPVTAQRRWI
jgi:CRP-like cAMP-binding protein